jgi:ferric-dicitrate binding protein FerR (iron transport regulator)
MIRGALVVGAIFAAYLLGVAWLRNHGYIPIVVHTEYEETREIRLKDGTRCVVLEGYNEKSISCDWHGRK